MFGIGSTELLVIIVVALIVLGPKSIPQIAKTMGKVVGEFRRVSTDFQRTLNAEVAQEEHDVRKKTAEKELFGNAPDAVQASPHTAVPDVAPLNTTPPDAATAAPGQAVVIDNTLASVDNTIPEYQPDSPIARAVAKAEVEAHTDTPPAKHMLIEPDSTVKGPTA